MSGVTIGVGSEQNYLFTYIPVNTTTQTQTQIRNYFISADVHHLHWVGKDWGLFGSLGYTRLFNSYHQMGIMLGGFYVW